MKLTGLSIIGQQRANTSGGPQMAMNPATGAALGPDFFWAAQADVEKAALLAGDAFEVYKRWPGKQRQTLLNTLAQLLEANGAAIIERANLETALPVARLQGELARTCFQLRLCGEAAASGLIARVRIDHGNPDRKPLPKPELRSMMIPLGPVAVFSASNFPLAFSVAGGDTASALAAGCPVIVKTHPGHMGTSEMVGGMVQEAVEKCGAPAGLFSMLHGDGPELGIALVKHPLIKAVGFTGSRRAGRAIMDAAAARPEPIPVYAEMSSVNPVFVSAEVMATRAEEIAAGMHGSVTLGVGQFCTNPGLIFVEAAGSAEKFVDKLRALLTNTPPGVMLTAGLLAAYRAGVEKFSKTPGVWKLTADGGATKLGDAQARAALFLTNAETFLAQQNLMEEVFGPSTIVVHCASRSQMIEAARRLEGQLTATVFSTSAELAANRELIDILQTKAGRLLFNGYPTGVEVAHAMTHGGPYPATSDGRSTSVGTRAMERFLRPVTYQNFPDEALPAELQESNPLNIPRLMDGEIQPANKLSEAGMNL
jgi:NADP-dependent aldehyde dehydrogenase